MKIVAPLLLVALALGCRTLGDAPAPAPMPHADEHAPAPVSDQGADAVADAGAEPRTDAEFYEGFLSEVPS